MRIGLIGGLKIGLIAGFSIAFFVWFGAAMLKGLITDFNGIWPEWFPGHIVDFILSRWFVIIVVATCIVLGGLIGALRPRRYDLL